MYPRYLQETTTEYWQLTTMVLTSKYALRTNCNTSRLRTDDACQQ